MEATATHTTKEDSTMNQHVTPLTFHSVDGRFTVANQEGGWVLVNRTTSEVSFLSTDMDEALVLANEKIA